MIGPSRKVTRWGPILIFRVVIFHKEGAITENALFLGLSRCISVIDGISNIPCLLALESWVDVNVEEVDFQVNWPPVM